MTVKKQNRSIITKGITIGVQDLKELSDPNRGEDKIYIRVSVSLQRQKLLQNAQTEVVQLQHHKRNSMLSGKLSSDLL